MKQVEAKSVNESVKNKTENSNLPTHKIVFQKIKKMFGENCAQELRKNNSSLLSIEELPEIVKYAGKKFSKDITVLSFLFNKFVNLGKLQHSNKNPIELLDEAGYNAFVADTLEKQDSIAKYFRSSEALCTFGTERYKTHYIIHAVKKNADEIKPKQYPNINDEYSKSVISIQFPKNRRNVIITNRYNHTITNVNTDETFHRCPDEIIAGLTDSIIKFFNIDIWKRDISLPIPYKFFDNKLLYCNIDYYNDKNFAGDGFYVKDGEFHEVKKIGDILYKKDEIKRHQTEHEILMENILLKIYRNKPVEVDGKLVYGKLAEFIDVLNPKSEVATMLNEEIADKTTIKVIKNEDKTQSIYFGKEDEKTKQIVETEFVRIKDSKIVKINIEKATIIPDSFLYENTELTEIYLPNAIHIGHKFLDKNLKLEKISLPKVETIESSFLTYNINLTEIDFPNLIKVGAFFIRGNENISKVNLPKLKYIGYSFLGCNKNLSEIKLDNAEHIGGEFLYYNNKIENINFPNVITIEHNFLYNNNSLREISLNNVEKIDFNFLLTNRSLTKLHTPNLKNVGDDFMPYNKLGNQQLLQIAGNER